MAIVVTALSAMPPGLTLQPDGKITGTPTASFTGSVSIRAQDGAAIANGTIQFAINLPGVPIPSLVQSLSYETFTRPFLAKGPEFISYTSWSSYTMEPIALNNLISYSSFSTYTMGDPSVRYTSFSTPFGAQIPPQNYVTLSTPFMVSGAAPGGFSTTIAAPLGAAGLTLLADNTNGVDDEVYNVGDLGFDFFVFGPSNNARNTTSVCSNSHMGLQYATGANTWTSFSDTSPNQIGLYIGAGDWSHVNIWAGGNASRFRIRYEGQNDRSGQPPATSIWEVSLFPNGVIMVVTGAVFDDGYTAIQTGVAGESIPFTLTANTSRVLTPVPGGMFSPPTYTVQTGSYS